MGILDRLRRKVYASAPPALKPALRTVGMRAGLRPRSSLRPPVDAAREDRLRLRLHDDPNDEQAFGELAEIVRRRAAEGHIPEGRLGQPVPPADPERAANDAVWALAEEMAGNPRAWHPLTELARLSIRDDREGALRRLGTAAERDPSGRALVEGLAMLREAGLPDEALGLGVGHWRPREHDVEAGRHLVQAAVEAGRMGEARRHLDALGLHPDQGRVAPLRAELEREINLAERKRTTT
jgi:hypothetical protein